MHAQTHTEEFGPRNVWVRYNLWLFTAMSL